MRLCAPGQRRSVRDVWPWPAICRAAGLDRLAHFLPRAGVAYAARRNEDLPGHPHVSGLSPWIRHRLVTEAEVITATRSHHPEGADKFLAEVWWRTYWKGWLELRPGIWVDYRQGLSAALNRVQTESGLHFDPQLIALVNTQRQAIGTIYAD